MALRVPKAALPTELRENMIKQLGVVPEPVEVLFNNPDLAISNLEFSAKVAAWDAADESLKTFAHMAVAAQVGCSWCLDINYFQALNQNLDRLTTERVMPAAAFQRLATWHIGSPQPTKRTARWDLRMM